MTPEERAAEYADMFRKHVVPVDELRENTTERAQVLNFAVALWLLP